MQELVTVLQAIKDAISDTANTNGFREIGRHTLIAASDTLTIANIPYYKYLKVEIVGIPTGGTIGGSGLRFNGDSGNNYSRRASDEGGADSSGFNVGFLFSLPAAGAWLQYYEGNIINIANQEKLVWGHGVGGNTAGAANVIRRNETAGKWVNTTDAISTITLTNSGTGDFAIGSEMILYGKN